MQLYEDTLYLTLALKKPNSSALPDRKPFTTFTVEIKENALSSNQLLQKRTAFHSTLNVPSDGRTMSVETWSHKLAFGISSSTA